MTNRVLGFRKVVCTPIWLLASSGSFGVSYVASAASMAEALDSRDFEEIAGRALDDEENSDPGPWVYSKMATLVPDPLLVEKQETIAQYKEQFGHWRFWDGDESDRPGKEDYCAAYKYRDIPGEFFPEEAWQQDAVFVNHLVNDGEKLVERTLNAIYEDYGRGTPKTAQEYSERSQMFHMEMIDLETQTTPPEDFLPKTGTRSRGGWTTTRSHEGLIRRLLHAMNSNDEFVVVLGGDAAAAGHGNHFRQAYLMQFHRIFSPIMARMGVKLVTRDMAMGHGLGTLQSSLGFSSLFGQDIDVLIWDGAMTELDAKYVDFFFRQGLLSSGKQGKIPYLWIGGNSNAHGLFDLMRWLHNEAGVDVGQLGSSLYSVPLTESEEQAATLPKAFQYVACSTDAHSLCNEKKHCTHCWIDRNDIADVKELFPHIKDGETTDLAEDADPTQRLWYPGWRYHQFLGRSLVFALLDALQDAINKWSAGTMGGPPLEDDEWHVTSFFDDMRGKVKTALANEDAGECYKFAAELSLPPRICRVAMKGATQHTPRANSSSITELLVGSDVPTNPKKVQYEGQDVHNECLDPVGDIDLAQIVNLRRGLTSELYRDSSQLDWSEQGVSDFDNMPRFVQRIHEQRMAENSSNLERHLAFTGEQQRLLGDIEPGSGWAIQGEKPGQCDGGYLSICGRDSSDVCPLLGYHDSRGEIVGTEESGWLVMNLPKVKEGIVIIKYTFYDTPSKISGRRQHLLRRRIEGSKLPDGDSFALEFAIDGEVTSWNKKDLLERGKMAHKEMEILTLMDKTDFTTEAESVQLALRVKGCGGDTCLFALSHVYWA